MANDGCIGPQSTALYELRVKSGAGAATISECMAHLQTDGSHTYHLDTASLNSLPAFLNLCSTLLTRLRSRCAGKQGGSLNAEIIVLAVLRDRDVNMDSFPISQKKTCLLII